MWAITSVLGRPEQTHAVGSQVDSQVDSHSLAWGMLQVDGCTGAGQAEDRLGLVRLDNLPVRARAGQVVDLPASCR
jgi:hypothetical protein